MSHFDEISADFGATQRRHSLQNAIMGLGAALLFFIPSSGFNVGTVVYSLLATPIAAFLFHHLRKSFSPHYSAERKHLDTLASRIQNIKSRVSEVYSRYPHRKHGELFKNSYALCGLPLDRLEEALAVGMYKEQREVFVTCFMRSGIAVRVTATIGSPRRCSNSDNIANWKNHFERLNCDEILQYHNHPVTSNSTEPSLQDFRAARYLQETLGDIANKCHSLLLYWNQALEWRIIEYNSTGEHRIIREFDITKPTQA